MATEGTLTYGELEARANRLAHHLRALGVGPEVIVGVCLGRSLELGVAIQAVLKAGGAILPLDPSYPLDRLAFMLADAGSPLVLTRRDLASRLPDFGGRAVRLDAELGDVARGPEHAPERDLSPANLAYVIYTSGSTGEPKGVMLTHGGLLCHSQAIIDLFELVPEDRVLQFCSLSFDVSIEEMLPAWAAGATVVLRPDDQPVLGRSWWDWVRDQRLTVLNLPTAYWQGAGRDLEAGGWRLPPDVRLVVVGGERVPGPAYRRWMRVGGNGARWLNAYGPAEATVTATAYEPAAGALHGDDGGDGDPPIGHPVGDATVHILDDEARAVAAGDVGEICIGGPGLARGYLGRPELTAERFIPDPFALPAGARLYRTGDVGRQLPSGEIEFLGRRDNQLKVRGFRIESEEVEAVLLRHPSVSEAAVTASEDRRGDNTLVAYVVAAGADEPIPCELRRFMARFLPLQMLPSVFVRLDALPRGPGGKLNRAGLPAPPTDRSEPGSAAVPPRNETEETLLAIWSQVLGIDTVGVLDDFFELGGHSLLATQVIAQAREAFSSDVPLRAIFESPTIAALARAIADAGSRPPMPPLIAHRRGNGDRLPLSLAQQQMLTLELAASPPGLFNVTAIHRFSAPVDAAALTRALQIMVDRHETLRTAFLVDEGVGYQVVLPTVPVELATWDLAGLRREEREPERQRRIASQDAEPFELARPPVWRAQLLSVADDDTRLVVTFDHLICDMTSAYVFLSEVTAVYQALIGDRAPELPPLPVQYGDFAVWQREWLTDERLASQYDFWRDALAGMPLGPALPFDHVPVAPSRRIAGVPLVVTPETYRGLEGVARATHATLFIVTVAVVDAVLAARGGHDDIVLSTTVSGRQRKECEGLIGMFAGMGRIRIDVSGDPSFVDLVGRARDSVLGLFEHQDIPFMKVRDALFPDFPKQADYARTAALIPNELLYFHAGHDHWAPGSGVVDVPASGPPIDELFFRGQLHPLSLTFFDSGAEMWGQVSYKSDFYDEGTVQRLATALHQVFKAVAGDPHRRVSELVLTEGASDV